MKLRDQDARLDEFGNVPDEAGPDTGGQSGDTQGFSSIADAADESVEELADTGQAYEAGVVDGIEDAANHPEQPVYTHEDHPRPSGLAPD
jgi:hypothetical protein